MKKKIPEIVSQIREYKPEEINYGYQKNISFSQLSMFTQCPHRWALQYKDGEKRFTSSIHTVFGTALHEVLQHYLDVMYEKSGAAADREDIIDMFEETLREEYKTQYKKNNNQHFSSSEEINEFYQDGLKILDYFKKKKSAYFSKKGWHLVGCEIPVSVVPNKRYPNVIYQGFLDVVMYHEPTNTFKIIDIKTSTRGWNDQAKKDEIKQFQLILYKQYFSEQFNIPKEDISIEFFIVKRKVWENSDYPIKRIQLFEPPSGKIKTSKALKSVDNFLTEAFTKDGFKDRNYEPNPSKWNCSFCPYLGDNKLCSKGVHS